MSHRISLFTLLTLLALLLAGGIAWAQGPDPQGDVSIQSALDTAFTYQGKLKQNDSLVNDTCDFQFSLWDADADGTQIGSTQTEAGVTVVDGLFTVQLDFGSGAFQGDARWLQTAVRCPTGGGDYTTLSPRQPLTAAPYAAYALKAPWSGLSGVPTGFADGTDDNTTYTAGTGLTLSGNQFSLNTTYTDGRYWQLGGNAGTDPSTQFLGTTDNKALELRANNARVLRLEPNATSPSLIGGYSGNSVTSGVVGATIGGGGESNYTNRVTDNYGTVGGGSDNLAGDDAGTTSDADYATVGGGDSNTASAYAATIGGGSFNTASGSLGTVAGGNNNTASGDTAIVGGGSHNTASGVYATIGGGWANTASGVRSTIGGGYYNTASGQFATVPGGSENVAQGDYSFAAGRKARAYNQGCFVLADATDAYEDCVNDNRFVFRVTNAFYIWTSADHTSGVLLPTGGTSWTSLSDRNVKENFVSVDQTRLLEALAAMPVQTWNLKAQSPQIRHVGPVAQDFNETFGYLFGQVESPMRINNMDAVGVALAAAQGLYAQNREQAARIEALKAENAAQQEQIDDLEARLAALEAQMNGAAPSRPLRSSLLLPGAGVLLLALGTVWMTRRKGGAR